MTWKRVPMQGARTGVQACTADNVAEKLGVIDGTVYKAPNGREFPEGTATGGSRRFSDAQACHG